MVHATQLIPTLGVPDIDEACAFYVGDSVSHASLGRTVRPPLIDLERHRNPLSTGKQAPPGHFSLYLLVDDLDAMYERGLETRVETGGEPKDKPWDRHDFSAVDLNGYRFVFASEIEFDEVKGYYDEEVYDPTIS